VFISGEDSGVRSKDPQGGRVGGRQIDWHDILVSSLRTGRMVVSRRLLEGLGHQGERHVVTMALALGHIYRTPLERICFKPRQL
jgi:hypothetical protein